MMTLFFHMILLNGLHCIALCCIWPCTLRHTVMKGYKPKTSLTSPPSLIGRDSDGVFVNLGGGIHFSF